MLVQFVLIVEAKPYLVIEADLIKFVAIEFEFIQCGCGHLRRRPLSMNLTIEAEF